MAGSSSIKRNSSASMLKASSKSKEVSMTPTQEKLYASLLEKQRTGQPFRRPRTLSIPEDAMDPNYQYKWESLERKEMYSALQDGWTVDDTLRDVMPMFEQSLPQNYGQGINSGIVVNGLVLMRIPAQLYDLLTQQSRDKIKGKSKRLGQQRDARRELGQYGYQIPGDRSSRDRPMPITEDNDILADMLG